MTDIELVIKIPEEDFERCKKKFQMSINIMGDAIANGIPLPKGHGRLKDIDEVERRLDLDKPDNAIAKALKNIIESVPTVVEADIEVKNE